jgi:hypothetical protein
LGVNDAQAEKEKGRKQGRLVHFFAESKCGASVLGPCKHKHRTKGNMLVSHIQEHISMSLSECGGHEVWPPAKKPEADLVTREPVEDAARLAGTLGAAIPVVGLGKFQVSSRMTCWHRT